MPLIEIKNSTHETFLNRDTYSRLKASFSYRCYKWHISKDDEDELWAQWICLSFTRRICERVDLSKGSALSYLLGAMDKFLLTRNHKRLQKSSPESHYHEDVSDPAIESIVARGPGPYTLERCDSIDLKRFRGMLSPLKREILQKIEEGYTLAEIGKMHTPNLSRQRIHQIVALIKLDYKRYSVRGSVA